MKDIKFYSNSIYISLPSRKKPRVELAIDSKTIKNLSFKLYQPFSNKAQFLKKIAQVFPYFFRFNTNKSEFIAFLDNRYHCSLVSSIYHATDKDKVVLQLQSKGGIIGYMKVGLTNKGNDRVKSEIKAFEMLKNDFIPTVLDNGQYQGHSFLLLESIDGVSNLDNASTDTSYLKLLNKGKLEKKLPLKNHPRIVSLKQKLLRLDTKEFVTIFNSLDLELKSPVCYEHGDFAPWNIINVARKTTLIDFEYFTEEGLMEFDLIKYHFQVASLLKNLRGQSLITYVQKNIEIESFYTYMTLFLLKEVCSKLHDGLEYSIEEQLLTLLKGKKCEY